MSHYFQNITKTQNKLHFDIHHLDVSLVNALRRVILSEVPTVGFRTEPHTESTVKIITNSSSLHNEYISHRFGMIPIGFEYAQNYDPEEYKYVLHVQNKTNQIIDVTTKDIVVLKRNKDSGEFTEVSAERRDFFFPPDPISKHYILINRLKPDTSGEQNGEELHIEATAVVSNGKENARWSPVCQASFHNKVDVAKTAPLLEKIKQKYKEDNNGEITAEEEQAIENRFHISDADRHFHVNKKYEPNMFEFDIESIGILHPKDIFLKAFQIISEKLSHFLVELKEQNTVTIEESMKQHNAIDIIIQNEDHTLGNLLQSHLEYTNEVKNEPLFKDYSIIRFIGYHQPHPLDDQILLRIGFIPQYESQKTPFDREKETIDFLTTYINKLIIFLKELEGDFESLFT